MTEGGESLVVGQVAHVANTTSQLMFYSSIQTNSMCILVVVRFLIASDNVLPLAQLAELPPCLGKLLEHPQIFRLHFLAQAVENTFWDLFGYLEALSKAFV